MFNDKAQVIKSILFLLPFFLFYLTMTIIDLFMIDEPMYGVNFFLISSIVSMFVFLLLVESELSELLSKISKTPWTSNADADQKYQTITTIYRTMVAAAVFIVILYYHFIVVIGRMFR